MPRSKEDDAARKREERSARSAARQHRLQHRLAQEAATLGAATTVAATVDDPVAVDAARSAVLPFVHCSRESERGRLHFVDRGAAATLVIPLKYAIRLID